MKHSHNPIGGLCGCDCHRGIDRFGHVAKMLSEITAKHLGEVSWSFVVSCTPFLARMDADAVDFALADLMAAESIVVCIATFYQSALGYCKKLGRPEVPAIETHPPFARAVVH